MPRALIAVAGAAALLAFVAAPAPAAIVETPTASGRPSRTGLTEVGRKQLSDAVLDLTCVEGDGSRDGRARAASRRLRPREAVSGALPLHGALGQAPDWLEGGDAERIAADHDLIVVMADGGRASSFSDWYGIVAGQEGDAQNWESFHVDELVPYMDAAFPTHRRSVEPFHRGPVVGRPWRLSSTPAQNPGLYGAAGEFSGAVDTTISYRSTRP